MISKNNALMKKISGNTSSIELFLHVWFIEMRVEGEGGGYTVANVSQKRVILPCFIYQP